MFFLFETFIDRGFSIAMFDYQKVFLFVLILEPYSKFGALPPKDCRLLSLLLVNVALMMSLGIIWGGS